MTRITIGTLASSAGVNVETVRFYERKGLLAQPERPNKGFRRYSEEALKRLRFIRSARELGFTLNEISELLSLRESPSATCEDVRIRAREKIEEIDRKVALLDKMRLSLSQLLKSCEVDGPALDCPILDSLEEV
jgi:MerR family copper efflux transcriptional regulator